MLTINLEIKIDKEKFCQEQRNACNENRSGWRIPAYTEKFNSVEELIDAAKESSKLEDTVSYGDWTSQGTYQRGAIEISSVTPWEMDEENYPEGMDDWEIFEESKDFFETKIRECFKDLAYEQNMYREEEVKINLEIIWE